MSALALEIAFWGSVAAVAWALVLFPVVLALRALVAAVPAPRRDGPLPDVSYVIVVHNEAAVIGRKLENVEATRYPRERLEVIVASDGSDDGTDELVSAHAGPTPVRLRALPRVGKNAALDAGVEDARGSVLVFSDADSMLEPDALLELVAPFADPSVGAVAGDYRYDRGDGADEADGERTYWRFDRFWKRCESRAGSVTSATGQLHAIRRELFEPVPDGVTDDFFVSTAAVAAGRRLWFEERAVARGPAAGDVDAEYRRKVRLIGRGFASVSRRRRLLDPRATGFYAVQLATHKLLRRLLGVPVAVAALAATALAAVHPLYAAAAVAQWSFHGLALLGLALRGRAPARARWLALPLYFDMACLAGLQALADFARGRQRRGWEPQRRVVDAAATAAERGR